MRNTVLKSTCKRIFHDGAERWGGRGRWARDDREKAGRLINKAVAVAAHCLGVCHHNCRTSDAQVCDSAPTTEGYMSVDERHFG